VNGSSILLLLFLVTFIFAIWMIYTETLKFKAIPTEFRFLKINLINATGKKSNQNNLNNELVALMQVAIVLISAGETPISSVKLAAERAEGVIAQTLNQAFSRNFNNVEIVKILKLIAREAKSDSLNRMALSIQNALDRGAPLIDVLQNQIRAMQSKNHAHLLKIAGRRELLLLLPVVFILMPISILFVIWPSIYQLGNFGF
jgi:tight adherence protein C